MQVRVVDGRLPTSDAFNAMAVRKTMSALRRFSDRFSTIEIRIADENGPRGGTDKRCAILAHGSGLTHVQSQAPDYYTAFTQALHKFRRLLSHQSDRRRG